MSKQSDAKLAQGYAKEGPMCQGCAHFTFDLVTKTYPSFRCWTEEKNLRCDLGGFKTEEKNLRCDLGGFKTFKHSWCKKHEPREEAA